MKLFLDIDGVMVHANPHRTVEHEEDGFYRFNPQAIEALNMLIKEMNIEEIILSTSHRFNFTLERWKALLSQRGILVEKLSRIESEMEVGRSRCQEILEAIQARNLEAKEVIILDDEISLNGLPKNIKSRLILTSPYIGLRDIEIREFLVQEKSQN